MDKLNQEMDQIAMAFISKLTIVLSLIIIQQAPAQIILSSLQETWALAKTTNSGNDLHRLQIEQAEQNSKAVKSAYYPSLSANFTGQDNFSLVQTPVPGELIGKPGKTISVQFGKKMNYSTGLSANFWLFNLPLIYDAKSSEIKVSLEIANMAYFNQSLREQTSRQYYSLLAAQKAVLFSSTDLEIADTLCRVTEDKYQHGLVSLLDLNKARINKNSAYQKLEQNRENAIQCEQDLKLILGLKKEDQLVLSENIAAATIVDSPPVLPENTAYLETYRLQDAISAEGVKSALAKFTPQLSVKAFWGDTQNQDQYTLSLVSGDWKPNSYVAVTLSFPLFTGFYNLAQYGEAKTNKAIAENLYHDQVRQATINDNLLLESFFSSARIAKSQSLSLGFSTVNLALAAQQYREGLLSLTDYLKIFDDHITIEDNYVAGLSSYLINKALIESR